MSKKDISKYLCMIVLKKVIQLLLVKVEYVNIENRIIESPEMFPVKCFPLKFSLNFCSLKIVSLIVFL